MADRTITIDIKANYEDVLKAQQYVKQMQSQQVEIKCVATIDGKLTAMNFEQAMAKLQNGTINKFNLVLDTADLQKSLKQAQSLVSKSADEIAQEFEKATKSRTTETLKKNYLGKKSFSGNSDKALKEYAQYLAKAQEQVNKTSLDLSNISGGADPDQIYAYTKALKEYLIILNDIEGSASKKGLAVNIDFDSEFGKIEASLREVGEKSTTMIQNWAKSAAESIPSVLDNVKKTYTDIISGLENNNGAFTGMEQGAKKATEENKNLANSIKQVAAAGESVINTDQYEKLVAELEKAKAALDVLREEYKRLSDEMEAERSYSSDKFNENLELSSKFKESQDTVANLSNQIDELNSKLAETEKRLNDSVPSDSYSRLEQTLTEQMALVEQYKNDIAKAYEEIDKLKVEISSMQESKGGNPFQSFKESLEGLKDTDFSGLQEKLQALVNTIEQFNKKTISSKKIDELSKAMSALKDIDLTKLSELKNADIEGADAKAQTLASTLNALGTVTTNTKSIKSLGEGLKSLSDVDFSKLSGLGNLDFGNLMVLSNIQFRKNAFDGLIDAMQKLSNPQNMNMDVLDRLSKIDFQGLQGLNYIKKAADANVTLSNGFVGMQQSRINSTLAKARKAGVTEDKLAPLVDAGTKLRETFNPANIGNLNIADEMQSWVAAFDPVIDAVEQATAKQNELVAAFNREGNTTDNVQKAQDDALSSFKKVISERSNLISKMTTTSGWTNQDQERMKQLTTQMLDYQKMYKDNPEFQDLINQGKASEKDIANNYSSILNSVQNQIDTIQAKYAQKNLSDNPYYQSLLNQFEAFKQLKEKFEANNFFNPEDAYNVMQLRGGIGSTDQQLSREVKNLDKVSDIFDSLNKKYSGKNSSDYVNADVFDQIKSKMQEIQAISQQGVINEADVEKAKSLKEEISDLESKLTSKVNKKGTFLGTITGAGSSDGIRQMKELIKAQEEAKGNKVNFGAITNNGLGLNFDVVTASGQLQKYKASVDEASGAVRIFMKSESEYVSTGQKFVNSLKGKFAELTRYFTVMDVFQKAMSFVKEGVSSVVEINTAMTELKKVTDETSDSYANFQKQAGSIASELGSTTSDVITATGDYARLGHTMEESAELAKSSVVLKNVSEYESVSEATEALTAMTQAYQNLDSMEITDKLNNIGNNFSISTEDLATGLQKSASVLSLMGNSIDEAAALITAGNSTLQDVNSVAAGIRTISLRIVGTEEAKQELESLGEDTTDYIVQTAAKQRATIMNYTAVASNGGRGVDILDANGNYKNTYEIFKEISGVYKEIQEEDKKFGTNRAQALVEVLAGEHFCLKNVVTHFYRTHLIALVA
nr:MAG TPA: minor tail protein [Caudoviricetes sp.]